jgi:MFS family permease
MAAPTPSSRVTAAYALAMAVGLLTGGRLGDIFGRRRVPLTDSRVRRRVGGVCRGAQGELIAARAAQGLLGAIMRRRCSA